MTNQPVITFRIVKAASEVITYIVHGSGVCVQYEHYGHSCTGTLASSFWLRFLRYFRF